MKNKFKQIFLIVLVVVMGVLFAACDVETPTSTPEATSTHEEGNGTTPNDKKQEATFSINNAEQTNDKWKMTYKGCEIKEKLDSFTVAEEDTEFIIVFFEIENVSEESQTFSIVWQEFYIDSIKAAQTVYGMSINNSFQLTAMPVEPGRKANGYFLFQASHDWNELEIIYHASVFNENEADVLKFTLTKNDN